MSLSVAIQMDPMHSINIDTDSTFMMALEAQRRGHILYHYLPQDLAFRHSRLVATARPLEVRRERGNHHTFGPAETLDLASVDVVLMRQDPPFDMAYITATHLLEHVHPRTLVVNDPASVRNAPEKLFVTHFPDLMPPTLITSAKDEVLAFRREYKDIIVKPLFGNGGSGVFHVKPDDENLGALLETFTQLYREPIIVQKYLPEIRQGDKRILLVDGEPVGAVSRLPQEGEARANFHAGGSAAKTDLTQREREICATIGGVLRDKGLVFVGIDVIGDYLTEINVTSPTGIQEINRLNGGAIESTLWDAIERRYAASR
ncbi:MULTISPECIES: glutathione synthase [Nitrospirillum]|uniref:Glutathione synthetase n=1 Tax=Nitrospirillum amazonense TaxID=28077 RepID=A0A560FB78_9PROT|nr:glutathione synthase [Nitrospirillum amazonense]MEC4593267.1 glutathione synthase [Nitrospirillum amazonense]TWB18868.1 glutathione synthase [Nitrospirillum amazonense]